jgi:5-oxoprolinase (ATP-hydrolysing)
VRELEFMRPLAVSILSERRSFQPYGLAGGECGARGENYLIRRESGCERVVSLGGKNTVNCSPGDRIRILSPGGGGWGPVGNVPAEAVGVATLSRTTGSVNQYQMNQETV